MRVYRVKLVTPAVMHIRDDCTTGAVEPFEVGHTTCAAGTITWYNPGVVQGADDHVELQHAVHQTSSLQPGSIVKLSGRRSTVWPTSLAQWARHDGVPDSSLLLML
jgi:hypothetical protein